MESLWQELSTVSDMEPPAWHEEVLRLREVEWEGRDQVSQDWTKAKEELCRELQ